jgi:hypothetical protein
MNLFLDTKYFTDPQHTQSICFRLNLLPLSSVPKLLGKG